MAEEQKQGKDIGELFVEFGAKGLGSLLKGLNSVSASFLLTKNAANQAIKPIVDMSQKAAGTVTAWDKLSAVMGMSLKELQDIEIFTRLNNIDFSSYIGQLKTVQQKLMDIRTEQSSDVQGLTLLGLTAYDFDPKKPLEFMDKVKQRVLSLDEVTAASALRWLGLSEDLLYAWKQQNTTFNDRLRLNDKELEKLKEQQSQWNILKTTWWAAQNKFMANQSIINDLLEKTTNWLVGTHPILVKTKDLFNEWLNADHPYFRTTVDLINLAVKGLKYLTEHGKNYFEKDNTIGNKTLKGIGTIIGTGKANWNSALFPSYQPSRELLDQALFDKYFELWQANPANPRNYSKIPFTQDNISSNLNNSNNKVAYTVNITQNITGTEANQIASLSANNIQDSFLTLQAQNQFNV